MESQISALERELLRLRRALRNDEVKLESTLDEMEHLKNSLSASTDDLAVKRAANEHARCAFNLHWLVMPSEWPLSMHWNWVCS